MNLGEIRAKQVFTALICLLLSSCRLVPNPVISSFDNSSWIDKDVKVVGLIGLTIDKDIKVYKGFNEELQSVLLTTVSQLGYTAIELKVFYNIYRQNQKNYDGFFDPLTGKKDKRKFRKFINEVYLSYQKKYDIDMLLSVELIKVSAEYNGARVSWHGTVDRTIYPPNSILNSRSGSMPAISLRIKALNLNTGQNFERVQGFQAIYDNGIGSDIHPEDMSIHSNNIRIGLSQLKKV